MKLAKKFLEAQPVIIPKDNSTDVAHEKKYIKAIADVHAAMKSFEHSFDSDFMSQVDGADYAMFHDAKRLLSVLSSQGKDMLDASKKNKDRPKQDKLTRSKGNK